MYDVLSFLKSKHFFLFGVATELEAGWQICGVGRRRGEKTIFPHLRGWVGSSSLQMVSNGPDILRTHWGVSGKQSCKTLTCLNLAVLGFPV